MAHLPADTVAPRARSYNPGWMAWQHITDDDLERYCLGMIKDETELAPIEEHLLACPDCVQRAEEEQHTLDLMCAGLRAERAQ